MSILDEPNWVNGSYSYWKKLVWRFVRTALAVVLTSVVTFLGARIATVDVASMTLSFFVETIQMSGIVAFNAMLFGIMTGVITSLAKLVRDYFSEGDKTSTIQKLPL